MSRVLIVVAAIVLTAGCATTAFVPEFDSPGQALAYAEEAEATGRWAEAVAVLDVARQRFPDEGRLVTQHNDVSDRWRHLKRLWEDQLAIASAGAALDEIERMTPLVTAEPDRLWLSFRKTQRERSLKTLRSALMDCAERRRDQDIDLAKSCIGLANRIGRDEPSTSLLATIDQRIEAREEEARRRKAEAAAARRARRIAQAERRLEQGDYQGATRLIDPILAADPEDQRAQVVRQALDETTTEQNTVLNELAARRYSLQDIETAIRLWQASLRIRPDQPDIQERLARALRIRENLEVLRQAKPKPTIEAPAADNQ